MYRLLISIVKELAESLIRNAKIIKNGRRERKKYARELMGLEKNGFYVVDAFFSKNECDELIKLIDDTIEKENANVWSDEQKSDNRVYFIDQLYERCREIYEEEYFLGVLRAYTGNNNPKGMLLAGRIDAVEGNLGSGGGWHRDSPFYHQTKAIIYLSDVDMNNGPFQYIQKSHKKSEIFKSYLKGLIRPGSYRFSEMDIDNYCERNNQSVVNFSANAGTLIFADTKGIHRGMPILNGRRYALFCYYWDSKIPKHFNDLKQKI